MRRIQNIPGLFLSIGLIALNLHGVAIAQSQSRADSVAEISADRTQVRWQPRVGSGHFILTVSSPDGAITRREFDGVEPTIKLIDEKGLSLADGHYVYELRVVPAFSGEVKRALKASREKGNSEEVIQELQKNGQIPATITVQSGSFLILNGGVLTGSPDDSAEPRLPSNDAGAVTASAKSKRKGTGTVVIQDVVTPDDVIIQGSECVGLDCVNNENFGFDTIRLKENNLRIAFDDTSTSAGFPSNDWAIVANDSANGGLNKFSIDDVTGAKTPFTLLAGAPTNSLFVSSTGKVGLRTSTPVLDLHITTSDTPAHRLEQTNAGGFTAQTWDIGANEANFFVRDFTGGSRLPFRIRPGAPTSSVDISANGDVGVGTASPNLRLEAKATGAGLPATTGTSQTGIARFSQGVGVGVIDFGFGGAAGFGWIQATSSTNLANNFGLLLNPNGGNVGIGTTNPLGKLDVNGTIFQRGVLLHADYVFEPTYTLESIEDHSAFMWNNKHLPAVGSREVDEQGREVIELGARLRGMLEEIEKAHIYISTLNQTITEKDSRLAKLERQNAELAERLARIEAILSGSPAAKK